MSTPIHVSRRGADLSPTSVALCNFVAKQVICNFEMLWTVFGEEPRCSRNEAPLRKRLENLVNGGYLKNLVNGSYLNCQGVRLTRAWSRTAQPLNQPRAAAPQFAHAPVSPVASAPAYNLRTAPVWVPPPRAAVRAGADDFLRCPSHGARC